MPNATPPFRIKGYYADANILGHEREIQYDPNEGGLWIMCSYNESHDIVNKLIADGDAMTNAIAYLRTLPDEQQDTLLTLLVNAVTGDRKPTRAAGRRPATVTTIAQRDVPMVATPKRSSTPLEQEVAEPIVAMTEEQEERAAIMEIDGELTREDAEAAVLADVSQSSGQDIGVTDDENPHPSEYLAIDPPKSQPDSLPDSPPRRGLDPAIARAKYAEQEALAEEAAKHDAEEAERKAEWERHQALQDGRGALNAASAEETRGAVQAAARAAVAEHGGQVKLAYEPEPGQRIREAPHAGMTVDPGAARQAPGAPAVYEPAARRPAAQPARASAAVDLGEFFAEPATDAAPSAAATSVAAPSDLPPELIKANTLRPVFEYLYERGHTTVKALAEEAFKLKDVIPFVARVNGLEQRANDWLTRMKEISGT